MKRIITMLILTALFSAQSITSARENFKTIYGSNQSIEQLLNQAKTQVDGASKFWLGFRFELRDSLDFYEVYIHNNGNISISSGRFTMNHGYDDDDTIKMTALRALGELGDEDATQKLKSEERDFVLNVDDWGVFFLYDAHENKIDRIKMFNRQIQRRFRGLPVVWAENVSTESSFSFLKKIIENEDYQKRVIEPAIFVASLHKSQKVVSYLEKLAGGDAYQEIRESAAFWLSQIPGKESFDALKKLYAKEINHEMKEKLIFGFSQHRDLSALNELEMIARTDRDYEMREKAIFWIGQNDSQKSIDILMQLLKTADNQEIKEKIVFSLSQHNSKRAVNLLIDIAKNNPDSEVREKAIFWLGQMASKKTLETLGDIVESDESTDVKEKAVFAISQHNDSEKAAEMLIEIARNNKNPHVRSKAIFWLGQTGDERAVSFFKDILVD